MLNESKFIEFSDKIQGYINEFVFSKMPDLEHKMDKCLDWINRKTYLAEIQAI